MDENIVMKTIERYCKIRNNKKRLSCYDAHKVAEELKIDVSAIGKLCDDNGIRIISCKLGCF